MKIKSTHQISKYLHGTFVEYFGTTIYDGIWVGKDSSIPNINGFRRDVVEGVRECGLTMFRWPGGCCAEKYHWMDGVGKDRMPRMHYCTDDPNNGIWDMSFGTDECIEFCRLCGMEPMFVVNVSTGTTEEFRSWYEYCNAPSVTKYGAMRAANGHSEPYGVKMWGIGNTDENTWVAAWNSGLYANDYIRFTAALDEFWRPHTTVVGLGLSIRHKHLDWARDVMDIVTCNGKIKGPDMLSVHHYLGSAKDKKCGGAVNYTDEEYNYLLDSLVEYEKDIDFHRELVKEHACQKYPTYLSMDEWGTWHDEAVMENGLRQRQTLRDAIFAAKTMHIFYRNSDFVKLAMETQLCNLLQSLFETDGEKFVKTATFWVMKLYREHLEQYVADDLFSTDDESVDAFASATEDGGRVVITAVNRDLYKGATLTLSEEICGMRLVMADIISSEDVRSCNTYEQPDLICAKRFDSISFPSVELPSHSIIRLVFEAC